MSNIPNNLTDVRAFSASTLALLGVINWGLEKYVFHGTTPAPVATALYVLLPALIGYLTTHVALNMTSPREIANLRKNFQESIKRNQPIVLPQEKRLQDPVGMPIPPMDVA